MFIQALRSLRWITRRIISRTRFLKVVLVLTKTKSNLKHGFLVSEHVTHAYKKPLSLVLL